MCWLILVSLLPLLVVSSRSNVSDIRSITNSSDLNKDMYVIHAMVYQVGIITNKTDNDTKNFNKGKQETVTFYHTNGSKIDFSKIPEPLLTNVTAQSLVGITPKLNAESHPGKRNLPWAGLGNSPFIYSSAERPAFENSKGVQEKPLNAANSSHKLDDEIKPSKNLFKRDVTNNKEPAKITTGTAVVPQEVGVHSIALPPLLTLNNNFSDIPVPVPNTSVVHYAKINTLVHMP